MVDKRVLGAVAVVGAVGAIGYILYTKSMIGGVVKITVINNCNVPATLCGVTVESGKYQCYTIDAGSTATFNLIKGTQFTLTLYTMPMSIPAGFIKEGGQALVDRTINLCGCVSQDVVLPQCG